MPMQTTNRPVALKATLRRDAIRRSVEIAGHVSIADLKERLGVSEVTIREDLKHLEDRQALTRIRGGAVAARTGGVELSLEETSSTNHAEKVAIGLRAAAMIRSGHTVIIDVGSTTTELAKALSPDLVGVVVITMGSISRFSLNRIPGSRSLSPVAP